MKDKILTLIIGILIGAIIASAGFVLYIKTNNKNNTNQRPEFVNPPPMNQNQNFNQNGDMPPELPNGEKPNKNGGTPQEFQNGKKTKNNSGNSSNTQNNQQVQ